MSNNHRTMHSQPMTEEEKSLASGCAHCGQPTGQHLDNCVVLKVKPSHQIDLAKQRQGQREYEPVPIEEFFDEPFVAEDAEDNDHHGGCGGDSNEEKATYRENVLERASEDFLAAADIEAQVGLWQGKDGLTLGGEPVGPDFSDGPEFEGYQERATGLSPEQIEQKNKAIAMAYGIKPEATTPVGMSVDKLTKLRRVVELAGQRFPDKAVRVEPVSNKTQELYKLSLRPKQLQEIVNQDLSVNNWSDVKTGGTLDEILEWLETQ